jgi:nicotinamide-nucleotide amidase
MSVIEVHKRLKERGKKLAIAESCTGGAIGAALTELEGASLIFVGSMVVYSDDWKERFLGVKSIGKAGAVSEIVVKEMGEGILALSGADYGLAVSGIAGPGGGTVEKPVGTVWMGVGEKGGGMRVEKKMFKGGRLDVVRGCVEAAFELLLEVMG